MDGSRKLVVLVDDDDDTREVERFLLEAQGGLAVVTAPDGRSALNLLDRIDPDVIVTDMVMPVLDFSAFSARTGPRVEPLDAWLAATVDTGRAR